MFIANQVDEAAMGVSREYANFLQVGQGCYWHSICWPGWGCPVEGQCCFRRAWKGGGKAVVGAGGAQEPPPGAGF